MPIPETPDCAFLHRLQRTATIAMLTGALGSVGLMLYAGRHNPSRILLLLFTLWVLSPFAILALAKSISKPWSLQTRVALHFVTLLLTLGSLAIYGYAAMRPPGAKPAPFFVMVPPASWSLIAIVVPAVALVSRRRRRR